MVNHHIPSTLQEALKILDKHDCYIMAGGTDLMVVKHQRSGLIPNFDKNVCYIAKNSNTSLKMKKVSILEREQSSLISKTMN